MAKFAITVASDVTLVKVRGFSGPTWPPLHPAKWYPFGVATVTGAQSPPGGTSWVTARAPLTVAPGVPSVRKTTVCGASAKFATSVRLAVAEKLYEALTETVAPPSVQLTKT